MAGRRDPWVLAAILLATFACYFKAIGNGFSYDDRAYVMVTSGGDDDNTMVRILHGVGTYFQRPYGDGIHQSRGFRPVTVLSFALVHHWFRKELTKKAALADSDSYMAQVGKFQKYYSNPAAAHHLWNILFHLLATFLVYLLVRSLVGPGAPPLWAAAFFGLHALHSDPVITIVGSAEVMSFAFGAAATLLALRGLATSGGPKGLLLAASTFCLFLSFGCKESALVWAVYLPLFLVVRARMSGQTPMLRSNVVHVWVLIVPVAVFLLLRQNMVAEHVQAFDVAYESNKLYKFGLWDRLPTAGLVYGYALYKLFVPWPLAADWGGAVFPLLESLVAPAFLLAFGTLVAVLVTGLLCWRRHALVFLAVATFFGFSFAVSNIIIRIETIYGERLYYTPLLGLCLFVAWLSQRAWRWTAVVGIAFLVTCGGLIVLRSFEWQDNFTLFVAEANRQPRSTGMNMNVAREHRLRAEAGDESAWKAWRTYIDRVIEHDPDSSLPYNELGLHALNEERFAEGEKWFQKSINARFAEPERDGVQIGMNLARLYDEWGKRELAKKELEKVLGLRPDCIPAWDYYMMLAFRAGDRRLGRQLLQRFEKAISGGRQSAIYYLYQGLLAYRSGKFQAAVNMMQPALQRIPPSPHHVEAFVGLIVALIKVGEKEQARGWIGEVRGFVQNSDLPKRTKERLERTYFPQLEDLSRQAQK